MPKWKDRRLEWFGIIRPFEVSSCAYYDYVHNARAAAERLRDEVVRYLGDDSGACERWKQSCNELWSFLSTIQLEKDKESQDQETESQNTKLLAVFQKLIKQVEHDQERFHQMTYPGAITEIERDSLIPLMWDRISLYYLSVSCAIVLTSDRDRYIRDALSVVGRLSNDGARKLDAGSNACERWQRGCDDLKGFVKTLLSNEATRPQETRLLTVFTELIKTFERVRYSLNQLAQSGSISERDALISQMREGLNRYYRFSSYAIVLAWLGMPEENHEVIRIKLRIG